MLDKIVWDFLGALSIFYGWLMGGYVDGLREKMAIAALLNLIH